VRRLTTDDLLDIGAALGAGDADDLDDIVRVQELDREVVGAITMLMFAILERRPFWRRNRAVAVVAADVLARVNGRSLELTPADEVQSVVARIAEGRMEAWEVGVWLFGRITIRRPIPGPRCAGCGMPLRESLEVRRAADSLLLVPGCASCGRILGRPFTDRPLQGV
jgi:hypothetical protein